MKFIPNPKVGSITAIFTVIHNSSKPDDSMIVIDFSIENLRSRLSRIMSKTLKKIKPEGDMLSWNTGIGIFCIYREYEYEDDKTEYDSNYKFLYHYVELDRRKYGGDVDTKKYFIKKSINDRNEDLEECFSCNAKMVKSYQVKRWGEMVNVCKKCKDFDIKIQKISDRLDREEAAKKLRVKK